MKNSVIQRISKSSGAVVLALVVSLAVWLGGVVLCFATLQNETAYSLVSGSVKTNEVTINEDDKKELLFVKRPFNKVDNKSLLHWDAELYQLIAQHLYDPAYTWAG